MEGAAGEFRRQPVGMLQHVPGGADMDGILALPRVAAKKTGENVESQHAGQRPASRRQTDAATQAVAEGAQYSAH